MKTVLITGATGFVGRYMVTDLVAAGWSVRAAVRRRPADPAPPGAQWVEYGDLAGFDAWAPLLQGVDAVIHLAGRAHLLNDAAADPLFEYRRINTEATIRLARAAADAGVRRFVFMSTVKAVCESTGPDGIGDQATPLPVDHYGVSKREAEQALLAPFAFPGMTVTVLRPPLVYGPGVRANFARLLGWVARGIPLPFGMVANRRSLVFVGNLTSAARFVLESPSFGGGACFVTDGVDLSLAELVRRIGACLGRRPWLWPIPPAALRAGLAMLGRGDEARRLLDSLVVRADRLRAAGWRPPFEVDAGLLQTVDEFSGRKER